MNEVLDPLLDGARVTIQVTLASAAIGTVLAVVVGLANLYGPWPIKAITRAYIEVFRGIAAVILLFWIFFAVPLFGPELSPMAAGIVALGTNISAYGAEVVRTGINGVPKGQVEAAIALDLTPFQRLRHVIFPQAVVTMLPPYGNLLVELMKGTALVSLITLSDLTEEAQSLRNLRVASSIEIFAIVFALYFLIASGLTLLVRLAERWASRGLDTGRGARVTAR